MTDETASPNAAPTGDSSAASRARESNDDNDSESNRRGRANAPPADASADPEPRSRTRSERDSTPETDRTPVLEATDVDHAYGSVSVLEDLSMAVDAGAVTALVGPNGSGKTTLLRVLAGLLEPTSGSVAYEGREATRRIGYLPQQPAFRPGFTVLETLAFYSSLVGADADDAMARLETVGLADAADRPVEALSGGMTRLAGIAQATIGDPPVVVLDEPASGLDPGMSRHVFEITSEFAAEGTAVLLSSHDLGLVDRVADEVAILDEGRIVRRGPPAALRADLGVDSLRGVYEESVAAEAGTVRVQGVTDE
ncbi:ABC-type multidrug transport system, ATPase component [Halobiforma haloterrestris]|uniref:ABC-type multidrug transport system, ATPase component n=1 Tax=Natronobacterium haloterrestre TaxID=148448 RepID=A0A1I1E8R1_NATHA|nr:ABC transporter ATP-binding protein [Halobiforma haloterrestris]SFB83474.1 ABC-type multidrug transport system, ATPase component [Halobiforma haloterrestris]